MELNSHSSPLPGLPRKPLENPQIPKPVLGSDLQTAQSLDAVLRRLPRTLEPRWSDPFPLLAALQRHDASARANDEDAPRLADTLQLIAAVTHYRSDERRTAEYLLRHREDVVKNRRLAVTLLFAARCAAEMDNRRMQLMEFPDETIAGADRRPDPELRTTDAPSVAEATVAFVQRAVEPRSVSPVVSEQLADAVTTALELAERHVRMRGKGPSVLAMRSANRHDARLVTRLRAVMNDDRAARSLARLVVGADGTAIQTSLLWWVAQGDEAADAIPEPLRLRWVRDLSRIEGATLGAEAQADLAAHELELSA
jgi:hypothetical protein